MYFPNYWGQQHPYLQPMFTPAHPQFVAAPPLQYHPGVWSCSLIPGLAAQPPPQPPPPPPTIPSLNEPTLWSSGLFDCWMDFKSCFITLICPCITFGQVAEIIDEGNKSCSSHGLSCLLLGIFCLPCSCAYTCSIRSRLRRKFWLKEVPCWDWVVHCFCRSCALCQEYRELSNRGFDVPAGWQKNVSRQSQGLAVAPIAPPMVYSGMTR